MPNDVTLYATSFLSRAEDREFVRASTRLSATTRLAVQQVDSVATEQTAKVEAVAYVGTAAMKRATMISQLELQLIGMVPTATGRIAAIADLTCLAMAEVVDDTRRHLR